MSSRLHSGVLEGEVNGPSYGSTEVTALQPRLGSQSVLVNGVGASDTLASSSLQSTTGLGVTSDARAHRTDIHAQYAQSQLPPTHPQNTQAAAAAAAEVLVPSVVEHVSQQVTVGEVSFSPPEELHAQEGDPPASAQGHPLWVLRLGEFLQRRVNQAGAIMSPLIEARTSRTAQATTRSPLMPPRSWSGGYQTGLFSPEAERTMQQWASQAPLLHGPQPQQGSESSTGSLTREQVLLEVQRQVSKEMQAFAQQKTMLELENQRLRETLERSQQAQHAQVMGRQEGRVPGNSTGPQGSVFSGIVGDRGGNPVEPCSQTPVGAGDPLGRQPEPREHAHDPASEPARFGVCQRDSGAVREGFSVYDGAPGELHGSFGGPGKDPLGVLRGQGQQPPLVTPGDGGRTEPGQDARREPPSGSAGEGSQAGPFRASDPLGLLVQGMTQLQSAVSESLRSKVKDMEVVKPGVAELPKLAELSENSAIDVGDWLHGLQNHMGDLSNGSSDWWREVMLSLAAYYDAYTRASHVGKLALRPEDYETPELKDPKWSRVDKRAASMLLASVPQGSLALLARIVVLYRPGSVVERQQILASLESPSQASNATEAVTSLRRWARWMSRAADLGIQRPDPSVLLRGLDSLCKKPLQDSPEISFRISMLRYNLEVDVRPTEKGVKDLHQALVSEFEQIAYRGSTASSSKVPFVKAITTAPGPPPPKASPDAGSPSSPTRAKGKGSTPCKYFLSDQGCSKARGLMCSLEKRSRVGAGRAGALNISKVPVQ